MQFQFAQLCHLFLVAPHENLALQLLCLNSNDSQYNQQKIKKFQTSDQPDRLQQGSSKDSEQVPQKHRKHC